METISRKAQLIIVIALIVVFLYVIIGLSDSSRPYCPDNTGALGTRAFYLLLSELGYTVQAEKQPYVEESLNARRNHALFLIGPDALMLSSDEVDDIIKWVGRGNDLFVLAEHTLNHGQSLFNELGVRIQHVRRDGVTLVSPNEDSPYGKGILNMAVSSSSTIVMGESTLVDITVHLNIDDKPVCVSGSLGKGRVFVVSDISLITNNNISMADNIIFFTNALNSLNPSKIILSRPIISPFPAHNGVGERGPGPIFYIQLFIIMGLFIYSLGRRLGPIANDEDDRQNITGNMEYMESMARLLRRGKAHKKVLDTLYSAYREKHQDSPELNRAYEQAIKMDRIKESKLMEIAKMMDEESGH